MRLEGKLVEVIDKYPTSKAYVMETCDGERKNISLPRGMDRSEGDLIYTTEDRKGNRIFTDEYPKCTVCNVEYMQGDGGLICPVCNGKEIIE